MRRHAYLALFVLASCGLELTTPPEVSVDFDEAEAGKKFPSDTCRLLMTGVYTVLEGTGILGEEVVGRWIGRRWCFFSSHDVVHAELGGGFSGQFLELTGYVRFVRSGAVRRISLSVRPEEGGYDLTCEQIPSTLIVRGQTDEGTRIVLKRTRNWYRPSRRFYSVAHRGGGRNSDRLGRSENSIPMLRYAQTVGADAVEIDVTRTRDGKAIIFHDDTFSPRTVSGLYLLGRVENFDLDQIKQYGQLIHGESIPTLEEALTIIVDSTTLSMVWLDIKKPEISAEVLRLQEAAMARAAAQGRDILIMFGIPNGDVYKAYQEAHTTDALPIIIEYDLNLALSDPACVAWGPRWTSGIHASDIERLHAAGKLIVVWTMDVREYVIEYLYSYSVDAMVTNYPSLVTGLHCSRQ